MLVTQPPLFCASCMAQQAASPRVSWPGRCWPPAAYWSGLGHLSISSLHGTCRHLPAPPLPPCRAPFKKGATHHRPLPPPIFLLRTSRGHLPLSPPKKLVCLRWLKHAASPEPRRSAVVNSTTPVSTTLGCFSTASPWASPSPSPILVVGPCCGCHWPQEHWRPLRPLLPHRWSAPPVSSAASRVARWVALSSGSAHLGGLAICSPLVSPPRSCHRERRVHSDC
jgi:hypothetical protein